MEFTTHPPVQPAKSGLGGHPHRPASRGAAGSHLGHPWHPRPGSGRRSLLLGLLFAAAGLGTVMSVAATPEDNARAQLVAELSETEGLTNPRVLDALRQTPRERFLPGRLKPLAYYDVAVPIGHSQTATPPSLVAYMTEQLDPQPTDRVLEIGTGCGYQAAVLSRLAREVCTIEIVKPLANRARATLRHLQRDNVRVRIGDGFRGWPELAPFDRIIVTCAAPDVPAPLLSQLKEGGRLVMPLGDDYQQTLYRCTKTNGRVERTALVPTVFVPMTGEARLARRPDAPDTPVHLVNGSFEDTDPASGLLVGWYHQRRLRLETGPNAPDGARFVTFINTTGGRQAHACQAFAVDGRRTRRLVVSGRVKATNALPGPDPLQIAALVITFYDRERGVVRQVVGGRWQGTFDWQTFRQELAVPRAAREAILHLGLLGATGTVSFDQLGLSANR